MLSITRQNVNDRISNRVDNIVSDQASGLLQSLTQGLRCYLHPVCFVLGRMHRHLSTLTGSKRSAMEPMKVSMPMPAIWGRPVIGIGTAGLTGNAQLAD